MYLHLGEDTVIEVKDIIGIFDLENTSASKDTKEFLRNKFNNMNIVTVSYDMPKSYIVSKNDYYGLTVYISPISVATLRKRSKLPV